MIYLFGYWGALLFFREEGYLIKIFVLLLYGIKMVWCPRLCI